MRHLENSCFIDDDPTLLDFLKKRPHGDRSQMPVYNINEKSVSMTQASPEKQSRLGLHTVRKSSEDRRFRIRHSSTLTSRSSEKSLKNVDSLEIRRQLIRVSHVQPDIARITRDRIQMLTAQSSRPGKLNKSLFQPTLRNSLIAQSKKDVSQSQKQSAGANRVKSKLLALL